jgi:hypothetical protein
MKAFISYSLNDQDQYILTLLSTELRNRGFVIRQSNDFHSEMSALTKVNINQSQLFIGLLTGDGHELDRVQKEWRLANTATIPSILLIENTVNIDLNFNSPFILFDRHNPQYSIDVLNAQMTKLKGKTSKDSNAWAWLLGGAAVLAIIGLLSDDD